MAKKRADGCAKQAERAFDREVRRHQMKPQKQRVAIAFGVKRQTLNKCRAGGGRRR